MTSTVVTRPIEPKDGPTAKKGLSDRKPQEKSEPEGGDNSRTVENQPLSGPASDAQKEAQPASNQPKEKSDDQLQDPAENKAEAFIKGYEELIQRIRKEDPGLVSKTEDPAITLRSIKPGTMLVLVNPVANQEEIVGQIMTSGRKVKIAAMDYSGMVKTLASTPDEEMRACIEAHTILINPLNGNGRRRSYHQDLGTLHQALDEAQADAERLDEVLTKGYLLAQIMSLSQEQAQAWAPRNNTDRTLTEAMLAKSIADTITAGKELEIAEQSRLLNERITTLRDQNEHYRQQISQLEEEVQTLKQALYQPEQSNATETCSEAAAEDADRSATDDKELPRNQSRLNVLLDTITTPGRYPNLRFLENATDQLEAYLDLKPTAKEISQALDAIDGLASTYRQSKGQTVGLWDNHLQLSKWSYSPNESSSTMQNHRANRIFNDRTRDRKIEVERHMTYLAKEKALQIYFDREENDSPFLIAYIGPHLPHGRRKTY